MGKKITQLATITEVADDDLIVGVDVSDTSGSDNGTNKKFTKATLLAGLAPLDPQLTGWNPDAETWVYHNVDDPTGYFKIEGKDVSANYSVGWRIMFTNGGNVIKGIITAITYSAPNTIITFLHEIDPTDNQALYLLANSAITENYVSPHKAPLGFPLDPAKWTQKTYSDSIFSRATPTANVWYNTGGLALTIPIGAWNVRYKAGVANERATPSYCVSYCTLSTANNSSSDKDFDSQSFASAVVIYSAIHSIQKDIILTSKTTYYLNIRTDQSSTAYLHLHGSLCRTIIEAVCAYL